MCKPGQPCGAAAPKPEPTAFEARMALRAAYIEETRARIRVLVHDEGERIAKLLNEPDDETRVTNTIVTVVAGDLLGLGDTIIATNTDLTMDEGIAFNNEGVEAMRAITRRNLLRTLGRVDMIDKVLGDALRDIRGEKEAPNAR